MPLRMRLKTSLFAKILLWFFFNLVLVATVLAAFFAFQPQVNLHAVFGQQGSSRLRAAGMLIAHELNQLSRADWTSVLTRHAAIHGVDFALILPDGTRFASFSEEIPEPVMFRVQGDLSHKPPRFLPPHGLEPEAHGAAPQRPPLHGGKPAVFPDAYDPKPHLVMQSRNPTRYWSGVRIPLNADNKGRPVPAILLAVSASITGDGFFFDPLPWMVVAAVVLLISVLFWVPMVRHITRPLGRMNRATEAIARGRFEVSIQERRGDEIGRLAESINRMAARLSAFVTGQKRFLGDVAHELGSPIARIQFGLGALEQRVGEANQERVADVMADVDHLTKLVNELLAFSRAEMKADTVKLERIDLLPVVEAAVRREAPPGVEVDIRVDAGIRALASADLLTRALANLLRNAVKYAAGTGPITVKATRGGADVVLEVKDRGPGVPETYLDRLFEPFFRPEAARDRDSGGVGLGLAIVKTCVDTCKGTVSAANLTPEGFAVRVTLKTA